MVYFQCQSGLATDALFRGGLMTGTLGGRHRWGGPRWWCWALARLWLGSSGKDPSTTYILPDCPLLLTRTYIEFPALLFMGRASGPPVRNYYIP